MAERGKIIRPNGECRELKELLGTRRPHRAFLQEFRPAGDMYLRPEAAYGLHGDGHSARVNVWGQILSQLLDRRGVVVNPVEIGLFAMTHDLRRETDDHDPNHGIRSADFLREIYGHGSNGTVPAVTYLNTWHVPHDWLAPVMTPALAVAKEADTLERLRDEGAFDPRFLRLPESKLLVAPARTLCSLSSQLQIQYGLAPYESVMEAAVEMGLLTDR